MTATREEILAAAVATSDRLNAEDLIGGPLTITIKDVHVIKGDKGVQKMIIDMEGREHPWHTCKSVTRTILAMWQDEPVQWIGRQMVLYRDPDVVFKNDPLGGIRIQSASHLTEAFTLTLTEHQKKRITRTIKPLVAAEPPKPKPAAQTPDAFLGHWRNEARKLCKDSLPIAKAISDAYKADTSRRDSMLDEAAQLAECDSVPQEDRVLLKAFCNAVFNEWTK